MFLLSTGVSYCKAASLLFVFDFLCVVSKCLAIKTTPRLSLRAIELRSPPDAGEGDLWFGGRLLGIGSVGGWFWKHFGWVKSGGKKNQHLCWDHFERLVCWLSSLG